MPTPCLSRIGGILRLSQELLDLLERWRIREGADEHELELAKKLHEVTAAAPCMCFCPRPRVVSTRFVHSSGALSQGAMSAPILPFMCVTSTD